MKASRFHLLSVATVLAASFVATAFADDKPVPAPAPAPAATPTQSQPEPVPGQRIDPNRLKDATRNALPGAVAPGTINPGNPPAMSAPAASVPAVPTPGKGILTFEETTHDFGKVYDTTPRKWSCKFKNAGTETLTISQVRPGCGCTAAQLSKNDYAPGEEGTIELTWNPVGQGEVTKPVTITSNDMNEPNKVINIKATMVPLVKLDPMFLQGGTVQAGTERPMRLSILSRDKDFTIKNIEFDQPMTWKEVPDETKTNDDNYPGRKMVEFSIPKDAPVGSFMRSITIKVLAKVDGETEARESSYNVRCFANIVGDLLATPAFVTVANAKPNTPFESTATVTSRSGKAFNIKSAEVADMNPTNVTGLTVKTEQLPENKGWKITLAGNTGEYVGPFRGSIRLVTDVEREGPTMIPFSGMSMNTQPMPPAGIPGAAPTPANTSPVATPKPAAPAAPAPAPAPASAPAGTPH